MKRTGRVVQRAGVVTARDGAFEDANYGAQLLPQARDIDGDGRMGRPAIVVGGLVVIAYLDRETGGLRVDVDTETPEPPVELDGGALRVDVSINGGDVWSGWVK